MLVWLCQLPLVQPELSHADSSALIMQPLCQHYWWSTFPKTGFYPSKAVKGLLIEKTDGWNMGWKARHPQIHHFSWEICPDPPHPPKKGLRWYELQISAFSFSKEKEPIEIPKTQSFQFPWNVKSNILESSNPISTQIIIHPFIIQSIGIVSCFIQI